MKQTFSDAQECIMWIKTNAPAMLQKHKKITVEISKGYSSRSDRANNFYWGVVIKGFLKEWPDYTKDMVHNLLCEQFRKIKKAPELIEKEKEFGIFESAWTTKSTTHDNTYEFFMYCEQCLLALQEIGGSISPEDTQEYFKLKQEVKQNERLDGTTA